MQAALRPLVLASTPATRLRLQLSASSSSTSISGSPILEQSRAYRAATATHNISSRNNSTPLPLVSTASTTTALAMTRREGIVPTGPYPLNGLLPKEEIQAASWLKRFPQWDGRNIRVAVLDTGVDPAAFGLNGKRKVVDIIDCSGGGDIPLKEVEPLKGDAIPKDATSSSDAIYLPGISDRTLVVSSKWTNPTSKWKVGYKPAFDLFPDDLVARRKRERKVEWDVKIGKLIAQATEDLKVFERKVDAAKKAEKDLDSKKDETKETKDKAEKTKSDEIKKDKSEEKAKKADLEARIAYLKDLEIKDPGPIIETVVWHDGKDWRAVAGGAEGDGEENIAPVVKEADQSKTSEPALLDLRAKRPMTDYAKEQHYERFGTQDLMSYSVNIYDEGKTLSLVCVSGTHGTHVAAIIGGHVENSPELNGVAPGVEIVSLKIGDTRLAALETHQALMRATKAILDTKCDICNMSFGEDTSYSLENRGQFVTMLRDEVIKKRNVIFVAAAGNAGPALSTIGAPATTSGIVAVGAFETPSMQVAEYALLDNVPSGPYTWSSHGPTYDGANITCFAPGAAVTGVPVYNLQRSQLMNGTSMASPSACGALSLVLSAMKAEKIPVSSARIHKAIKATAKDVKDPQNIGLVQVEAMWQHLSETKDIEDSDAEFEISVISQGRPAPQFSKPLHEREGVRGVYLREPGETNKLYEAACWVKPSFPTVAETEKIYKFDMKLALTATEAWVRVPDYLSLPGNGRNFNFRVDPTKLSTGLHCAEIRAYDTATHGRLVFTVPITVCKPEESSGPSHTFKEWHSTSGQIERRFLAVPEGATWAELRLTTRNHNAPVGIWLHCVQLYPLRRLPHVEMQAVISSTAGETVTKKINVTGGRTLEVCTSQFWNSLPSADISLDVQFHGLTAVQGRQITVLGGSELVKLQIESKVRLENFSPSISFDRLRTFVRPTESKLIPLGERDVMPDEKRLYQLVNSYSFKIAEKTKIKPFFPITDSLYDSPFAVLTALFDSRKQLLQTGTVYSKEIELKKGDYTFQLELEHTSYKVLESLKGMALSIEAQLGDKLKKLSLDIDRDPIGLLSDSKGQSPVAGKIPQGATRPLVIGTELKGDLAELYKVGKSGDVLLGKLVLGGDSQTVLTYVLPPKAKEDAEVEEDSTKDKPLLVDLQLQIVDKIKDDKEKRQYLDELLSKNPKHLPLLVASLKAVKEDADVKDIEGAADLILKEIDESELAAYLGRKPAPDDEQTEEDKKLKKTMDTKKAAFTLAYTRKLQASYKAEKSAQEKAQLLSKSRTFMESPDKDPDFALITIKRDIALGRFGTALKALQKLLDDGTAESKYKELVELKTQCLRGLKWTYLTEYESRWTLFRSPPVDFVW